MGQPVGHFMHVTKARIVWVALFLKQIVRQVPHRMGLWIRAFVSQVTSSLKVLSKSGAPSAPQDNIAREPTKVFSIAQPTKPPFQGQNQKKDVFANSVPGDHMAELAMIAHLDQILKFLLFL